MGFPARLTAIAAAFLDRRMRVCGGCGFWYKPNWLHFHRLSRLSDFFLRQWVFAPKNSKQKVSIARDCKSFNGLLLATQFCLFHFPPREKFKQLASFAQTGKKTQKKRGPESPKQIIMPNGTIRTQVQTSTSGDDALRGSLSGKWRTLLFARSIVALNFVCPCGWTRFKLAFQNRI